MFQDSITDLPSNKRWPTIASVTIQLTLVAALLTVPLMHPEVLTLTTPRLSPILLAPRPPKPPIPIRVNAATAATSTAPTAPSPQPSSSALRFHIINQPVDQPILAVPINLGAGNTNPFASVGTTGPAGPNVVVGTGSSTTASPSHNIGPLNISRGVTAGLLINPIQPVYPQIARITHTEGTVILQAIISKTGHIESVHVVSGPAILQASALEAVHNARYHPYLLNGQPTEVETTISINFRIGS